ncbi:DUF3108 domain-containing protein [Pelagibacteraceae bacterium]|nr:DUF3108 domain-containing protein [Pelagibacteraceae bacterium]
MKLFLNSFVFLLFVCWPLFAQQTNKSYVVKVSGIKIGELNWQIKIDGDEYLNKISLKSKGLLSTIYSFKGEYLSKGLTDKNKLIPKKYKHFWQTKKTVKKMELTFNKNKLISLKQEPAEEEKIKLNVFDVEYTNDPLTSFQKIMMGEKSALVVDGRRLYTMVASFEKNKNQTTIEISNYFNLWADHKRNKFEKIIYEKEIEEILPYKMFIYFDGRVFKLELN